MTERNLPDLIGTPWLADRLTQPGLRVVDASWLMPSEEARAVDLYRREHIPDAVFLDLDAVSDPAGRLPHTLAPAAHFAAAAGALGIVNDDTVIVYDGAGLHTAARAWWLFRAYGHRRVAVLDGGLRKWRAEGRPLESGAAAPAQTDYRAVDPTPFVRSQADVAAAIAHGLQVVDARSAGRYRGDEPEPRAGLRAGHIPGSRNLPYTRLLDPQTGTLLDIAELMERFLEAGVDVQRPVICSCGSGVTACVLRLALARLGAGAQGIYDGSWSEWGSTPGLAVATGP